MTPRRRKTTLRRSKAMTRCRKRILRMYIKKLVIIIVYYLLIFYSFVKKYWCGVKEIGGGVIRRGQTKKCVIVLFCVFRLRTI